MASTAMMAQISALAGDPGRAAMLDALMDGRALTASELAGVAGVTPQTASGHLSQLLAGGLVLGSKQGRHRYFRLAGPAVAHMIEAITEVAQTEDARRKPVSTGPRDRALRYARTCYDHLAGHVAVRLADAMIERRFIEMETDAALITEAGLGFLETAGIDISDLRARLSRRSGRLPCRACLDWSERRPHVAGMVGAALCRYSMEAGWTRRKAGTRAVDVTPKGYRVFRETFGARLEML